MQTLPNGNIKVRRPLPIVPKHYRQDPNNPCIYIPDYPECEHRYTATRQTVCGKTLLGGQTCGIDNELVTVPICQTCTKK